MSPSVLSSSLHEKMLDLDVVMRAREAESRGGFDGAARRVVQLADESSKIDGH